MKKFYYAIFIDIYPKEFLAIILTIIHHDIPLTLLEIYFGISFKYFILQFSILDIFSCVVEGKSEIFLQSKFHVKNNLQQNK